MAHHRDKNEPTRTTATALQSHLMQEPTPETGGILQDRPRKDISSIPSAPMPPARTTLLRSDVGRAGRPATPPQGLSIPELDDEEDD